MVGSTRQRAKGAKTMSELRTRIQTAAILAPLAIAAVLLLDTPGFALVLAALFAFGMTEWARLIGLTSLASRALLVGINVAVMAILWEERGTLVMLGALLVGIVWWPLAALWLRYYRFGEALKRRYAGLKALAGSLIVIPAWAAAVTLHREDSAGPWWVLYVLMLIWVADICAYFAGRRYGRTKLAPNISPGKTRAGLYGALIGCGVFSLIVAIALDHGWQACLGLLFLSFVTVLFSVVGDLFESLIKRHANHKDSGRLLPGHGGIFDRFDSLFAALPVFAVGKLALAF